ncbi:hypothetical protein A33K_14904 [Burkholderia humptydooensis MSMB43]|uniref:Uncharacterized protein n=1 Tax=Burkholderia humptydooensis MSMB43 TaxID=441157 RepID=A0ABN0G9G3_9BURK|nr:hypothetical protein A33K_14904 [Burkholderia humptydooensis MSMB43]
MRVRHIYRLLISSICRGGAPRGRPLSSVGRGPADARPSIARRNRAASRCCDAARARRRAPMRRRPLRFRIAAAPDIAARTSHGRMARMARMAAA